MRHGGKNNDAVVPSQFAVPVMSRVEARYVTYDQIQFSTTATRLRDPTRNSTWTIPQSHQAMAPRNRTKPKSATAGVTNVVQIPMTDRGTESEGQVLPSWCDQHQFRSIVFVAARDHSLRWRRVLNRVMKGHPIRVMVQPARYSDFDPDRWWKTRDGVRTEIVEIQKLVLDAVLHPLSF